MYLLIYEFLHVAQIMLLLKILGNDLIAWISAISGALMLDIDHLPLIKKFGLRKFIYLRTKVEAKKPRKYAFHNFFVLGATLIGSFLILNQWSFYFGIFFLSAFLHLIIDLVYAFVFLHTIEHWFP
ncbi:MAG: hypothetical protein QW451_01870 [Candidatus Aenigmatarchaeota archaeon]